MDAPEVIITGYKCCGIKLRNMGGEVVLEAYINEPSSLNPYAPDYNPYETENGIDYYVPEYFEPDNVMPPRKHSEDTTAPTLNGMTLFVGIQDDGFGGFVNYNFTPAQMVSYVAGQASTIITAAQADISTVTNPDDTLTDAWFSGKSIQEITTNSQTYLLGVDFVQTGDAITLINLGSWYDGQILRAKI